MPKLIIPQNLPKNVTPEAFDIIKSLVFGGRQIFGVAAASLTWGIEGSEAGDVTAGIEGEKMTSKILRDWITQHPTAMLVNSVKWPGSEGDSDHVLLIGNTVYIIDSKRWKSKRKYSVTSKGTIKRGTVDFPEGNVKMIPALKAWSGLFPSGVRIKGIVCIAQSEIFVQRNKEWYQAPYRLVTAEELTSFLDEEINKMKPDIVDSLNLGILAILIRDAIKPRDRRKELINVGGMR